jgi:hypothetical protein
VFNSQVALSILTLSDANFPKFVIRRHAVSFTKGQAKQTRPSECSFAVRKLQPGDIRKKLFMQTVTDHGSNTRIELRKEMPDPIVAELLRLSEQVEASLKVLQAAAAREQVSAGQDSSDAVFVLDDVAARHAAAEAALVACGASLTRALEFLLNGDATSRPAAQLRLVPLARD